MSILLLTGVTGFLGPYIFNELQNDDNIEKFNYDTIRLLVRNLDKAREFRSSNYNIELVEGDLSQFSTLKNATNGINSLIHTASLYGVPASWQQYQKVNVEGAVHLIKSLSKGSKIVLTSSAGIYGHPKTSLPIKEDFKPIRPTNNYIRSKLLQERIMRKISTIKQFKFIAIRPSSIIGAGSTRAVPDMIRSLKNKRVFLFHNGTGVLPVVHPHDVARAHILALENIDIYDKESFNVVSFHTTFKQYFDAYAKELGLPPVTQRLPYKAVLFTAKLLDMLPGFPTGRHHTIEYLGSSRSLDTSKSKNKLKFYPKYDLESSIKDAVN